MNRYNYICRRPHTKSTNSHNNVEEDAVECASEYAEISVQDNNIYFYTDVNPTSALELILAITDLTKKMSILAITHNIPTPAINLYINSDGGDVHSALSVFDTIKRNPTHIKTIISGNASSAATIISLAGHSRVISPNSYMLIHNISSGFWGKMHEFEDEMKNMSKLTSNLKKIYKENTNITKTQLDTLLKKDLLLDAKTCVKYGLVETIE
jgi:ATP-dependent Clp endopeptidase proteolytic subunit ClpP